MEVSEARALLPQLLRAGVRELRQVSGAEFVDQMGRRIRFRRIIEKGFVKWTFEFI